MTTKNGSCAAPLSSRIFTSISARYGNDLMDQTAFKGGGAAIVQAANAPPHGISLSEAVRVWARVAALSFGGPAGQIAVMHRVLVDEKHWIGENRFLHALN